ncbi:MAG: hypothetical protein V4482_05865 [Pseudomonadota bacterium]
MTKVLFTLFVTSFIATVSFASEKAAEAATTTVAVESTETAKPVAAEPTTTKAA